MTNGLQQVLLALGLGGEPQGNLAFMQSPLAPGNLTQPKNLKNKTQLQFASPSGRLSMKGKNDGSGTNENSSITGFTAV